MFSFQRDLIHTTTKNSFQFVPGSLLIVLNSKIWSQLNARQLQVNHHENKSVLQTPPYTPFLYSKSGVYRGLQFFLFFLQNIDCVPTINVLEQKQKKYYNFSSEN